MAAECLTSAKVCGVRATRLLEGCDCATGSNNAVATSAVVRVSATPVYEAPESYELEDDCSGFCISISDPGVLKYLDIKLELVTRDLQLIELMTGAPLYVDGAGAPIGISRRSPDIAGPKVAVEIWVKNIEENCVGAPVDPDDESTFSPTAYTRLLWPYCELDLAEQEFANEIATVKIVGRAYPNENYRLTGCWNDIPPTVVLDLESPEHSFYDSTIPVLGCGYIETPVPVVDDTAFLQALIDVGGVVNIPTGFYTTAGPLYVDSGVKINLNGSVITKAFIAAPPRGSGLAMFRNRDYAIDVDGFEFHGPGTIGSATQSTLGKIFMIRGADVVFDGFTIDTYGGGQAMYVGGDDMIINNVTIGGSAVSAGTGAIRYVGGVGLRCTNCNVTSGDDCYQFVPANNPADPFFGMSTSDGEYRDCVGTSTLARLIIVLADTNNTAHIDNCRFVNVTGYATRRGMIVWNRSNVAANLVHNISVTDCSITMRPEAIPLDTFLEDVLVRNVENVTFTRLTLNDCVNSWVRMDSGGAGTHTGCVNVLFDSCTFNPFAVAGITRGLFSTFTDGCTLLNCVFNDHGTASTVTVGEVGGTSTNFTVQGCSFNGLSGTTIGVSAVHTVNCVVDGNEFFGTTSQSGVKIAATSTNAFITNNDFSNLLGTAWNNLGVGTTISGNITTLLVGVGVQASSGTALTTLTAAWPSGYTAVAGHLGLVLMIGRPVSTNQPVPPAGWALNSTRLLEAGANDLRVNLYWKILTAAEAAPGFLIPNPPTWGGTAGGMAVQSLVFQNIDPTTPFDATTVTSDGTGSSTFTPTGITTVSPFAIVVSAVGTFDDNALALNVPNSFVSTGIIGSTYDTQAGGDMSAGAAWRIVATPGPVTCPTWDQTINGPTPWAGLTFALRRI